MTYSKNIALLTPLDLAVYDFLMRQNATPPIALAGAMAAYVQTLGHACFQLRTVKQDYPDYFNAIDLNSWENELKTSPLVAADADTPKPLVIDENGRVFLYRNYKEETELAENIRERLQHRYSVSDEVKNHFNELFPFEQLNTNCDQAIAAFSAIRHQLTIITGTPGTGKTTTAAAILSLLFHQNPNAKIAIAAPTGKAAKRLTTLIQDSASYKPIHKHVLNLNAQTIHRLLNATFKGTFQYNKQNKLHIDALLVDESSMIDLHLFHALFSAVPTHARIILIGDANQLASVNAGGVFSSLTNNVSANELTNDFANEFYQTTKMNIPTSSKAMPWNDQIITLQHVRRTNTNSPLNKLAATINKGDCEESVQQILNSQNANMIYHRTIEEAIQTLTPYFKKLAKINTSSLQSPIEALDISETFRILSVTNNGDSSIYQCNALAKKLWHTVSSTQENSTFGMPIIITVNDYKLGLMNGTTGIIWPNAEGQLKAWFKSTSSEPVLQFNIDQLPAYSPAWVITIHKSQGSEYQHVLLTLPEMNHEISRILSRELLYTAVTRSQQTLSISGSMTAFRHAIKNPIQRASALSEKIFNDASKNVAGRRNP